MERQWMPLFERWIQNCYNSGDINYLWGIKYMQVWAHMDTKTRNDITKYYVHFHVPNCVTCQCLPARTSMFCTDRNQQVLQDSSFINIVIRYIVFNISRGFTNLSSRRSVDILQCTACNRVHNTQQWVLYGSWLRDASRTELWVSISAIKQHLPSNGSNTGVHKNSVN